MNSSDTGNQTKENILITKNDILLFEKLPLIKRKKFIKDPLKSQNENLKNKLLVDLENDIEDLKNNRENHLLLSLITDKIRKYTDIQGTNYLFEKLENELKKGSKNGFILEAINWIYFFISTYIKIGYGASQYFSFRAHGERIEKLNQKSLIQNKRLNVKKNDSILRKKRIKVYILSLLIFIIIYYIWYFTKMHGIKFNN